MVNLEEIKADLKIDYPCNWSYTVIIDKDVDINDFIKKLNIDKEIKTQNSKHTDKYKSYKLSVLVDNEAQRLELFSLLKKSAKFVL